MHATTDRDETHIPSVLGGRSLQLVNEWKLVAIRKYLLLSVLASCRLPIGVEAIDCQSQRTIFGEFTVNAGPEPLNQRHRPRAMAYH